MRLWCWRYDFPSHGVPRAMFALGFARALRAYGCSRGNNKPLGRLPPRRVSLDQLDPHVPQGALEIGGRVVIVKATWSPLVTDGCRLVHLLKS
jgi:hypothetical protein